MIWSKSPVWARTWRSSALACKTPHDIVGFPTPQRYAGVGALHDLVDDLAWRQVRIDHDDVLTVMHDLTDIHVSQIQNTAQHAPFLLTIEFIAGVQFDRAAERFFGQCLFAIGRYPDAGPAAWFPG